MVRDPTRRQSDQSTAHEDDVRDDRGPVLSLPATSDEPAAPRPNFILLSSLDARLLRATYLLLDIQPLQNGELEPQSLVQNLWFATFHW
jgi:hypothetical protein